MGKIMAVNISEQKGTQKKTYTLQRLLKTGVLRMMRMQANGIVRSVFFPTKK